MTQLILAISCTSSCSGWKVFIRISSYAGVLGGTLFLLYIKGLTDNVICDIAVFADDTTLYSKCDQGSDRWQQLELASQLESDIRDTVDWGKKWLVDFNAGKTVLEEKSSFKMLGLTFSSNLDQGSQIVSIAKTASKKI